MKPLSLQGTLSHTGPVCFQSALWKFVSTAPFSTAQHLFTQPHSLCSMLSLSSQGSKQGMVSGLNNQHKSGKTSQWWICLGWGGSSVPGIYQSYSWERQVPVLQTRLSCTYLYSTMQRSNHMRKTPKGSKKTNTVRSQIHNSAEGYSINRSSILWLHFGVWHHKS